MIFNIDSDGGYIGLGDYSITWGNAQDPFFEEERMEGFCTFSADAFSIEFGAIDQERPGIYFTRYGDGDIESTTPLIQF
jgi:hypothetical protein